MTTDTTPTTTTYEWDAITVRRGPVWARVVVRYALKTETPGVVRNFVFLDDSMPGEWSTETYEVGGLVEGERHTAGDETVGLSDEDKEALLSTLLRLRREVVALASKRWRVARRSFRASNPS